MTPDRAPSPADPFPVMFMYWGRRGAMSQFMLELGRAALANPALKPLISISRQNELFPAFAEFGPALVPVDTFATHMGAATQVWRTLPLRRQLASCIRQHRLQAVIETMPHVWSPLVAPVIRRAGARFISTIHDADAHAGDPTGLVHGWGIRAVQHADLVVTLSDVIAARLARTGRVPPDRIRTLFHPDLRYGPPSVRPQPPAPGAPFRILFLGRIMPYKGLPMLVEAIEQVRARTLTPVSPASQPWPTAQASRSWPRPSEEYRARSAMASPAFWPRVPMRPHSPMPSPHLPPTRTSIGECAQPYPQRPKAGPWPASSPR